MTDTRGPAWSSEILFSNGLPTHVRSVWPAKKRFRNQEVVSEFTFGPPTACPEATRAHEWLATCDFLCKLDTMEPVDPH